MEYPREFIKRVKLAYPTWGKLHEKLDIGDTFVGRYLADGRPLGIPPKKIIELLDDGEVDELRSIAMDADIKGELYSEWCDLYNAARK